MDIESFWDVATRAADLLPDAPTSGDTLEWMSWRELVWETARRLGALSAGFISDLGVNGADTEDDSSMTAHQLVGLSVLLHNEAVGVVALPPGRQGYPEHVTPRYPSHEALPLTRGLHQHHS